MAASLTAEYRRPSLDCIDDCQNPNARLLNRRRREYKKKLKACVQKDVLRNATSTISCTTSCFVR